MHFSEPNKYIDGLKDGRIKVVTEQIPFVPGSYVGINSFGFGGSNTHVLLKAPEVESGLEPMEKFTFPKLILYSGRTRETVETLFSHVYANKDDFHLQQLLAHQV